MIRSILVSVGNAKHEVAAFEYALNLAKGLNAFLVCAAFPGEIDDEENFNPDLLAAETFMTVREECREAGVRYETTVVPGKRAPELCRMGRMVDLIAVGMPEEIKTKGLELVYNEIDDILIDSSKPVLVVHENCLELTRILIVHRGDNYSDRALELATELSERLGVELTGLAIADTVPESNSIAKDMLTYFRFRGLDVEVDTELGFTVANIIETADKKECDLIALGASRRGKLYEAIFNSTTDTVAKLANRAVLVCK